MIGSDKDFLIALGKSISGRRKALGLTQAELAFRIGMEVPNLSVIENGRTNPQALTLLKIASAMSCELRDLIPHLENPSLVLEAPAVYIPRKHKAKKRP